MSDYSHRDFTGRTLIEAIDLDNQVILNSCFSQETDGDLVHIFPEDMTGVNFVNCNLDNVFIPPGNQAFQLDRAGYPDGDE